MWRPRPNPLRKVLAGTSVPERLLFSGAIFAAFSAMGFITDVMSGGSQPSLMLLSNILFAGTIAVAYAWTAVLDWRLMAVPFAVHLLYTGWIVDMIPAGPPLSEWIDRQARLRLDGIGLAGAITLSYIGFLTFINRTGVRQVATRTEIALARDIHRVLVPPLALRLGDVEFSGRSLPSGDVGGDLMDVVDLGEGAWIAYVADVSGHGVSSGLLMGMVKSAVRMRVRSHATASELLTDLNTVLEPLKSPAMFVTLAIITRDASGRMAYSLAGHLPILRIRPDGSVEQLSISHLPVGMMPGTTFGEAPLALERGETLAMLTDGLIEVFDRKDDDYGLPRIEALLARERERPLDAIADRMLAEVRAHGAQLDDQTWLFVRRK
jgi:hypothetical protein